MTDQIIQSNNSSSVLRSLVKDKVAEYDYSSPTSAPILAKNPMSVGPRQTPSGVAHSQEVTFLLPRGQLLRDLQIETTCTSGTETLTRFLGLTLFESIQFRSGNKIIHTLSDSALLCLTVQQSIGKALAIYRRAMPLNPTTFNTVALSETSRTIYTPIFSSFFLDTKNAYDLGFMENLEIVCRYNSQSYSRFSTPITAITSTNLWYWTWKPDMDYYNELRALNFNPAKPMNMLCFNTFKETLECTAGAATSTQMKLNCTYPVFKTMFYISDKTAASYYSANTNDLFYRHINSFSFQVGGQYVYQSCPKLIGNWESSKTNSSDLYLVSSASGSSFDVNTRSNNPISLEWGLEPDNWMGNTGAMSFVNANNVYLTVNYADLSQAGYTPATTGSSYELVVVHAFWNILSIEVSNSSAAITSTN